jgi:hypothetical protein
MITTRSPVRLTNYEIVDPAVNYWSWKNDRGVYFALIRRDWILQYAAKFPNHNIVTVEDGEHEKYIRITYEKHDSPR